MTWHKYKELMDLISHMACRTEVLLNNFKDGKIDILEFREGLYSTSFQYQGAAGLLIDLVDKECDFGSTETYIHYD